MTNRPTREGWGLMSGCQDERQELLPNEKQVPDARPTHPDKELESLLCRVEDHGWRVMKAKKYYKCFCPCSAEHMKTVHLTPSGGRYALNTSKWFERQECWEARS